MDDGFLAEYFDWAPRKPSRRVRLANRLLRMLGVHVQLGLPPSSGSMTNIEKRINMFHLASAVLAYGVPGDFVEAGCHAGQSAVLLQKVIDGHDPGRALHVYDSFSGLPELTSQDHPTRYRAGQMKTTPDVVFANFQRYGLRPPVIHAGWFEETLPAELPATIAFAHLDGDLYRSILTSLTHVYPRLSKGAVCLIDDYAHPSMSRWNGLPGVRAACEEFLRGKPERVSALYAGDQAHGFFRKI